MSYIHSKSSIEGTTVYKKICYCEYASIGKGANRRDEDAQVKNKADFLVPT